MDGSSWFWALRLSFIDVKTFGGKFKKKRLKTLETWEGKNVLKRCKTLIRIKKRKNVLHRVPKTSTFLFLE